MPSDKHPEFPHYSDLLIRDPDRSGSTIVNPKYRGQLRRWEQWVWSAPYEEIKRDLDESIEDWIKNTPKGSLEP